MKASIKLIEYYLPEKIVNNSQLEKEFPGWSGQEIEKKVGIRERHVTGESETALDLAVNASQKILNNYDKEKIDFILLCTQSPDYLLPSSACILQDRLGLRKGIGALDYTLGCSGFVYGLALSKGLIHSGIARSVLLVMAETYTKHIHPSDISNRTIFGDGAVATIIEASEQNKIFNFSLGTDGSGAKNLIVPNSGARKNTSGSPNVDTGEFSRENNLYMNGPEIFNFTIEAVPQLVRDTLSKNDMTIEKIDYVIFHQANKFMIDYLRKKIKIPESKFYSNIMKTGNIVSGTIPLALKDSLDKGIVKPGDTVLLAGFGVGYSWAGTIIKI